eukprot:gb/GFBE01059913.1/.p1 GENE.gb/GFBE01059913.1/~~gb/GFBE01059913.1/.p1  ORF type:complete len:408 (+),score=52.06 gb/GFBE01059913.1/:1-1224(+)
MPTGIALPDVPKERAEGEENPSTSVESVIADLGPDGLKSPTLSLSLSMSWPYVHDNSTGMPAESSSGPPIEACSPKSAMSRHSRRSKHSRHRSTRSQMSSSNSEASSWSLSMLMDLRSDQSVPIIDSVQLEECYDLVRHLGRGSYGMVGEYTKKGTDKHFAVKTTALKEEEEVRITKRLNHPNIVRLHESFCYADKLCLVMDLCLGGDLDKWMMQRFERVGGCQIYMSPESRPISRLAWQMLSAVVYLHYNSIAHRDIKPANFLLDRDAELPAVKLSDFNLACFYTKGEPMTQYCGSLDYMAPEVITRSYTELCDIWSVGIVIQYLVCGVHLWPDAPTDQELEKRILEGNIELDHKQWKLQDEAVKPFVLQLLVKETEPRPPARRALRNEWLRASGKPSQECCCGVV